MFQNYEVKFVLKKDPIQWLTNKIKVSRKGSWTLFVEFPGQRYARSPRKFISRDSYPSWIMEVCYICFYLLKVSKVKNGLNFKLCI